MIRLKLSTGDVFRFAKSAEEWGYGQILRSDIIQYIVVFEPAFQSNAALGDIVKTQLLLCGWTADARFYSGDWERVGNMPAMAFSFPEYKVGISGRQWVTDVEGNALRLATPDVAKTLRFQSSESPITFEKAFKAHHGDLPWESRYEELLCHHKDYGDRTLN
jgi:hypothetical protein